MCDISEAWVGPTAHVGLVDGGTGGHHLPAFIPRPTEQLFLAEPSSIYNLKILAAAEFKML